MKRLFLFLVVGLHLLCGRRAPDLTGTGAAGDPVLFSHPLIVTAADASTLIDSGYTVVDGRQTAVYAAGHIPGAVNLSWETAELYDMPLSGNDVDLAAARTIVAGRGLDNSRRYLVYGGTAADWGAEGRVAWLFDLVGIESYRVILGGYGAWTGEGKSTETTVRTLTAIDNPQWGAGIDNYASTTDIENVLTNFDYQFIDNRADSEWTGDFNYGSAETVMWGHIPGAVHLDFADLYQAFHPGYLKPPADLSDLIAAAGLDTGKKIITYCTGGVRSAFAYFGCRLAGLSPVNNYDKSYGEWGLKQAGRPVSRAVISEAGYSVLDLTADYISFINDPAGYLAGKGLSDTGTRIVVKTSSVQNTRRAVRSLAGLGYRHTAFIK